MNGFECLIPILNVKNFARVGGLLRQPAGFQQEMGLGRSADLRLRDARQIEIFFSERRQGQPGTWISIFVEDADALHEEYKKSGAIIRQPRQICPGASVK
jgi:hypothetical protein